MKKQLLLIGLSLLLTVPLLAQVSPTSDLFLELKTMDSLIFDLGFNQCELAITEEIVSDELDFYHDQAGIQNKAQFLENVKKYICADTDNKPIRKLVEGSVQVFPLYQNGELYGAIQQGEHQFYIRTKGQALRHTSTAKFTHTWLLQEDKWRLQHVLSYDHQSP